VPMTGDKSFPIAQRDGLAALAREMGEHGVARNAPPRAVMALLGDRWTHLVLLVLVTGEFRHAELRRVLSRISAEQAISQRVLTLKLRELERDGFVLRTVSSHIPPQVGYSMTELGEDLVRQSRQLLDWINRHAATIEAARADYDSKEV
jgi:DNA-binding HxlR family transcriptional regulator